ncbi:MAG: hypothetical protein ACXVCM_14310, partial [Ktedonobacteraceae bacterium]
TAGECSPDLGVLSSFIEQYPNGLTIPSTNARSVSQNDHGSRDAEPVNANVQLMIGETTLQDV